jgi:Tol biopolymer transport system component/DNA-binding winged helix-turn-helix (wHTH) protein
MAAMLEPDRMIYSFDGFQLDARKRLLVRDGQPVQVTSKAFDLLLALIESGGCEISKDELMERVWTNQIVEDANLTVTMSQLRKALGEKASDHRFIVTIPGRGYRFVGELQPRESLIVEQHTVSEIVIDELDDGDKSIGAVIETRPLAYGDSYAGRTTELTAAATPPLALPPVTVKSSRRFLLGGLIVAALITAGLVIAVYLRLKTNPILPFAGAPIKQLTTKGSVGWSAISPDGKFYVYTLLERGEYKSSLWLGEIGANNDLQLRSPADVILNCLAFSPDGKTLYFNQSSGEQLQSGLFKMPVLGGVTEKIPLVVRGFFALSADGKQIAFTRANKERTASALVVANLDGTNERELVTRPLDRPFASRLTWSPDNKLIAVTTVSDVVTDSREIFVVRVADGSIKQLTSFGFTLISNVVWRPDGQGLILVAASRNETVRHLWHVDYPAGNANRISHDTDTYGSALSISADGNSLLATQLKLEGNIWIAPADNLSKAKQITFSSINGVYGWSGFDWAGNNRIIFTGGIDRTVAIYSMNADGSDIRQITSAGFNDQLLNVTADERFIVFQSNRSGANEIWRVNLDGSDLRQLTTGGRNHSPHPTPDGKFVIYVSTCNGKDLIWRVSIDGGEPAQITDKEYSSPRVSPDGKFIACGYKADANAPEQLAILRLEDGKPVKLFDVPRTATFNGGIRWTPEGDAVCYRDLGNGVWRQSTEGGAPKRLEGLPEEKAYLYNWSRDGKLFAFIRAREIGDAVLLRDFR